MKLGMGILFACMLAAGYLLAPAILIWGWFRWAQREHTGGPFFLSFFGFILSTASALLVVFTITYAVVIHSFAYYDPWLLRIFRWGALMSLSGIVLALTGIGRQMRCDGRHL
jgi:hypothetical protein